MKCRHCDTELANTFIDLGSSPPSNSYLTQETIKGPEKWYPLRVLVCRQCWLVQTEDFVDTGEMFSEDYAYFSSCSTTWVEHARSYVNEATQRFNLNAKSNFVEIAANDGYLLQFVKEHGIPCYGIEPTHSTAEAARKKGIEIIDEFFGATLAEKMAESGRQADFTAANNVLAHVPDINDFVKGFSILLKPTGVATFEFPHLLNLVQQNQFDTIYHEHYSYLSLTAVNSIFRSNGLEIFDVEELSTHGGSLRVFAQRSDHGKHKMNTAVSKLLAREQELGMLNLLFYEGFQQKAEKIKDDLLAFLLDAKKEGKNVIAYGAAAKGNTILNFAGIRSDLIQYVVDRSSAKQGKYMPGSRIPIVKEEILQADTPDYVLILPWNLRNEISGQLKYVQAWGGQFVTAIPKIKVD